MIDEIETENQENPDDVDNSDVESVESEAEPLIEVPVNSSSDAGLPEHRDLSQEELEFFKGLLESVLFLSTEPVGIGVLAKKCSLDRVNARIILDSLVDDYHERDGGFLLKEIAGGYQFITSDRYSNALKEILKEQKKDRLSRSTIETLQLFATDSRLLFLK